MSDIIKIMVVIVLLSIIIVFLRSYKGEYALLLQLSMVVTIGFIVITGAEKLIGMLEEISSISSDSVVYLKVLLKALCISILTDVASSFCIDCSNQTLSKSVELIGKAAILSLSFPILKNFIESIILFLG